jgi:hypothetical protein
MEGYLKSSAVPVRLWVEFIDWMSGAARWKRNRFTARRIPARGAFGATTKPVPTVTNETPRLKF